MNRRPQRHRPHGHEPGKSSFGASPQDRETIRHAIDNSLYSVRFNAQDMRSVIHAAKTGKKPSKAKKKRRVFRPDLIFAMSFMILVALPLTISVIRSKGNVTNIIASPGQATVSPQNTTQGNADVITTTPSVSPTANTASETVPADSPAPAASIDTDEAIRIARECFEMQCDTTIFSFEEYKVNTSFDEQTQQFTITLDSIYKNGCRFTVVLSGETGSVIQYSAPKLATVPTAFDSNSAEVRAWFTKYGEFMFTWPQDVQAEFSRRYQGATLRTAREGEISAEEAVAAVSAPIESSAPGMFTAFYPVLYSERSSTTGQAVYLVYCYPSADENVIRESTPMTVSFDAATGEIISIENNPLENELTLRPTANIM